MGSGWVKVVPPGPQKVASGQEGTSFCNPWGAVCGPGPRELQQGQGRTGRGLMDVGSTCYSTDWGNCLRSPRIGATALGSPDLRPGHLDAAIQSNTCVCARVGKNEGEVSHVSLKFWHFLQNTFMTPHLQVFRPLRTGKCMNNASHQNQIAAFCPIPKPTINI